TLQVAEHAAEERRRERIGADSRDNFAEFLFELARQPANEFTSGGRGVRIVFAGNYIVCKHLRCTSDSLANSQFLARNRISTLWLRPLVRTHSEFARTRCRPLASIRKMPGAKPRNCTCPNPSDTASRRVWPGQDARTVQSAHGFPL